MNVVSRAEADIPDDPTCCCTSGSDQGLKTTQNVAAGVAGIFIPVLWFGMDFKGTADKETQALQARQQYLASLAAQRRCGEPQEPPPRAARPRAAPRPAAVPQAPAGEK